MSRIAKMPVIIPKKVTIHMNDRMIIVKENIRSLSITRVLHESVAIKKIDNKLFFSVKKGFLNAWAQVGTARSLVNSMIIGVTDGFIKKLQLVGIGYRAIIKKDIINLSLGFSNSIDYKLPEGVFANCPSQTEITLRGIDKQVVGQVAADLRSYRKPEYYKGKGIRYFNEIIRTKESKKSK